MIIGCVISALCNAPDQNDFDDTKNYNHTNSFYETTITYSTILAVAEFINVEVNQIRVHVHLIIIFIPNSSVVLVL